MDLKLDPDELNTCVQCGLCLPHCPTFRVTGDESYSPRGRIQLMREVQDHDAPLTSEVLDSLETCVQCRGCEPACPSGVPYGHLIERTRETLAAAGHTTPAWMRVAMKPLTSPTMLGAGSRVLAVAQRLKLVPNRLGITTTIPLRQSPLRTSGDDVYLFTGCVMDAWQREVHQAGQRVLEAAGFGVTPTGSLAPCCGALQAHAGLTEVTRAAATAMMKTLPAGDGPEPRPILVDSAGCGAAMKDYGRLLGTPEAEAFSARVFDISEFLAMHMDRLPQAQPLELRVAIQDPCHLRHVQLAHGATRTVLGPYVSDLVELDDDGMCCGAGGAYSLLQPDMATQIRDRKLTAIDRAAPQSLASANPGCAMHLSGVLAATNVEVCHPMQLLDRALNPSEVR